MSQRLLPTLSGLFLTRGEYNDICLCSQCTGRCQHPGIYVKGLKISNIVRLCSVYRVTTEIDFEGATLLSSEQMRTREPLPLFHYTVRPRTSHLFVTIQIYPGDDLFRIENILKFLIDGILYVLILLPAISGADSSPHNQQTHLLTLPLIGK